MSHSLCLLPLELLIRGFNFLLEEGVGLLHSCLLLMLELSLVAVELLVNGLIQHPGILKLLLAKGPNKLVGTR